jgi:hypothetical protein
MLETNNDIDFSTNNDIPIEEVIAQMEKELQMSGEYYVFTSADPPLLIRELADYLSNIKTSYGIANLFYRIDVSTKKADPSLPTYEALSLLAWNRVFQKVWFRRNFV